jgi:adenylate cyclase
LASERVERRLTAILAADVAGYSRLMGADEEGTLAQLKAHRQALVDPKITEHRGRIVKTTGDGALVEFTSVVDALRCAVEIQRGMAERNTAVAPEKRIDFRIGINVGDIIMDAGDIFGDGVNVAARLEGLAEPGGICVSGRVQEDTRGRLAIDFEDIGEQQLKNIAWPVRAYRVRIDGLPAQATPVLTLPDKPSIAVLPFTNMSGDPEQEYLADGLTEDITTALSKVRWFFVISRNSSFTYKGKAVDVKRVARELGVRYVLEGSVRRAANRLRVTAQLVDAITDHHIWAERYDRDLIDIFAVQDEITDTIAATMEPEIGSAERERARRKLPEHLGAWEHHQRGMWHLLRRNRDDLVAAQAFFRKAIELDPTFATPRAALALSCFFQITHGFTIAHASSLDELFTEASQAVALDPKDALGHTALGLAFMERRDHLDALAEHQIALSLNSNSSLAHWAFGYALHRAERLQEALEQFEAALRLSPRDPGLWSYLTLKASTLYQLRQYDEAVRFARDAARHSVADLIWPYVHMAAALGQLGRTNEALAAVEELRRRRPGLTVSAVRSWPHNRNRSERSLKHILEGLRLAGLPEQ